jgi:2-polyprenyl-3-methyl-5-hydroxy-6-metoxy-1,4-benzoquinol methylase
MAGGIEMSLENEKEQIRKAYWDVLAAFPFREYMTSKYRRYVAIASALKSKLVIGESVLDVGCGPCDLAAILSRLGHNVTGIDDLKDPWHLIGNNRNRIVKFARHFGVKLVIQSVWAYKERKKFDAVLLMDVLEHVTSPRELLNQVIPFLKPGGFLFIETPNSAALGKRMKLMLGRTVWPDVDLVYFNVGDYRTHVREYTIPELRRLLWFSGLSNIEFTTGNFAAQEKTAETQRVGRIALRLLEAASWLRFTLRDTVLMWGTKPKGWSPFGDLTAFKNLKKHHLNLMKYNMDRERDKDIVSKMQERSR